MTGEAPLWPVTPSDVRRVDGSRPGDDAPEEPPNTVVERAAVRANAYFVKYIARPLTRLPETENVVALTFDDGPNPEATAHILDTLARENVPATFFMLGRHAAQWPALVRRAHADGHLIGNHSFSHARLTEHDLWFVWRDIHRASALLTEITGARTRYFRPPYGGMNPWVSMSAHADGLHTARWSLGTWDTDCPGADVIARRTVNGAGPGEIVLLHDGDADDPAGDRMQTAEALPIIIRDLRARGFAFTTLDGRRTLRTPAT